MNRNTRTTISRFLAATILATTALAHGGFGRARVGRVICCRCHSVPRKSTPCGAARHEQKEAHLARMSVRECGDPAAVDSRP